MLFLDEARILVKAGDGGNGCLAFRREKYVPRGGPAAAMAAAAATSTWSPPPTRTLSSSSATTPSTGQRGRHGEGSNKTGADGAPSKSQCRWERWSTTRPPASDCGLHRAGPAISGGARRTRRARQRPFRHSTHQAPTEHEPGRPGEEKRLRLELKLLADVGLVGFPNAGKSTLISRISAARPKIADYPFTTLEPNLGVVRRRDFRSFVVADIPGLIEGAHWGTGWASSSCATSSARACWCTWWTSRKPAAATRCTISKSSWTSWPASARNWRQADAGGGDQNGCGAGSGGWHRYAPWRPSVGCPTSKFRASPARESKR